MRTASIEEKNNNQNISLYLDCQMNIKLAI